jgi:hypothetical protein
MWCFFIYSQFIFHRNGIWTRCFFLHRPLHSKQSKFKFAYVHCPCALCSVHRTPFPNFFSIYCILFTDYMCVSLQLCIPEAPCTDSYRWFSPKNRYFRRHWAACYGILMHLLYLQFTVYRQWCRPPVHRVYLEASVFREGILFPSFLYTIHSVFSESKFWERFHPAMGRIYVIGTDQQTVYWFPLSFAMSSRVISLMRQWHMDKVIKINNYEHQNHKIYYIFYTKGFFIWFAFKSLEIIQLHNLSLSKKVKNYHVHELRPCSSGAQS